MITEFEVQIGLRIRKLREKLGYSREKLSEMANISTKFLYEIECGKKGMSVTTLHNISTSLKISSDYLLTGKVQHNNLSDILAMLEPLDDEKINHIETVIRSVLKMMK